MNTMIQPYLFFEGICEEAIEFYKENLGADVEMLMRYKECPDPLPPEMTTGENAEKVMHATICIGESKVMLSDSLEGACGGEPNTSGFSGFSLSLGMDDEAEATRVFELLAEGGTIEMPLGKTFWSPCFGMLKDRFGMGWMVSVVVEP